MKPYKCSKTGEQKLWFNPGQIDDWMEVELRKANLYPTVENPQVDIECFVDRYLDVDLEQYAPLGETVLGETRFEPGKRVKVLINKNLTEIAVDSEDAAAWLRSKWRMTMAHEATHVLLHKTLYPANNNQGMLFALEDDAATEGGHQTYQHLERNEGARGPVDWREVQANKGMAALLMPKELFLAMSESERERLVIDRESLLEGDAATYQLAKALAVLFDVSVQSVQIRLKELNVLATPGQPRLL